MISLSMKKIYLLLILSTAVVVKSFAQYNLIAFTEQGEKFWLVINGVKQNADPQTNVKVTGLPANSYKLKVIFQDNNIPDMDKNLFFNDPGEYSFNIKKNNKGEYVLRIVSQVPVPATAVTVPHQYIVVYGAPVPITTVVATPETVTQHTTTTTTGSPDNVTMNMGVNIGGVNAGVNLNVNDGTNNVTQSTTTTYSTTTTTTSGNIVRNEIAPQTTIVYVPGYGGPVGCPAPMNVQDFSAAKNSISQKSFESTKLEMAKQIVASNCFIADQVKEVMQLFDFEASKLEFAKYAYSHTYDKGNYFKVNDAFEFDSSVSDLSNYISGK